MVLSHSIQTIQTISPRYCHYDSCEDFVNFTNRFISFIDAKVGMLSKEREKTEQNRMSRALLVLAPTLTDNQFKYQQE